MIHRLGRRCFPAVFLAALASALGACTSESLDYTTLEVRIDSELHPKSEIDEIRVVVKTPRGERPYKFPLVSRDADPGYSLPLSLAFTPSGPLTEAFRLEVTALFN